MFMVLRKSNIILAVCIMLVFVYTALLWLGGGGRNEAIEAVVPTFAAPTAGAVIVIDAGHGE